MEERSFDDKTVSSAVFRNGTVLYYYCINRSKIFGSSFHSVLLRNIRGHSQNREWAQNPRTDEGKESVVMNGVELD